MILEENEEEAFPAESLMGPEHVEKADGMKRAAEEAERAANLIDETEAIIKRAEEAEAQQKATGISEAPRKASGEVKAPKRAAEEADGLRKTTEEEAEVLRVAEANQSVEVEGIHQEKEKSLEVLRRLEEGARQEYDRKRPRKEADEDRAEPRAKKLRFTGFTCSICPHPYTGLVASPTKYSTEEALHGHMAESHFLKWILKRHLSDESSTVCRLREACPYQIAVFFNIVQKGGGGGQTHVQKICCGFCIIFKAFWQHNLT